MGDMLRDTSPRLQSYKKHLGQCRIFKIVLTRLISLYTTLSGGQIKSLNQLEY